MKTLRRRQHKIVLEPANPDYQEMVFDEGAVEIYGRVVTVLRRL